MTVCSSFLVNFNIGILIFFRSSHQIDFRHAEEYSLCANLCECNCIDCAGEIVQSAFNYGGVLLFCALNLINHKQTNKELKEQSVEIKLKLKSEKWTFGVTKFIRGS